MPVSPPELPPQPAPSSTTAVPAAHTSAALLPLESGNQAAWAHQPQWRVLELGTGTLTPFLQLWAAWQRDAARPRLLHYVLVSPHAPHARSLPTDGALHPLASALAPQLYGLLPGVHRISLEGGQVLLTLWLGEHQAMLRQQSAVADQLLLGDIWHIAPPADGPVHLLKALARHCRRGSQLHIAQEAPGWQPGLQPALLQSGFVLQPSTSAATAHTAIGTVIDTENNSTAAPAHAAPSAPYAMQARFDPAWAPRQRHSTGPLPVAAPGTALVIGAGLAGSAAAHSLALRGWQVTVLVAGDGPADGASGLPAGLFCPHVSPDDSVLSRLSRNGVRLTLERLRALCQPSTDWAPSGVLEHCTDGGTGLPPAWAGTAGDDWSHTASATQLAQAGLPPDTVACWHAQAGWVRPAQLVQAQLQHPQIQVRTHAAVAQLQRSSAGHWQALDTDGTVVAQADLAVLAAGPATAGLLPPGTDWQLQPIRGQITLGPHTADNAAALPPFPVNGNGNLVTQVPAGAAHHPTLLGAMDSTEAKEAAADAPQLWVMGSTFERDVTELPISAADQAAAHAVNHAKLSTLLPASGTPMAPWFDPQNAHCLPTWGRVRVASHDRLPIAGPVDTGASDASDAIDGFSGLWALTALGARGLTLSILCGELLAARLHGEPLPLDAKLAQHLGTERLQRRS